jgi:hypothetical protein
MTSHAGSYDCAFKLNLKFKTKFESGFKNLKNEKKKKKKKTPLGPKPPIRPTKPYCH